MGSQPNNPRFQRAPVQSPPLVEVAPLDSSQPLGQQLNNLVFSPVVQRFLVWLGAQVSNFAPFPDDLGITNADLPAEVVDFARQIDEVRMLLMMQDEEDSSSSGATGTASVKSVGTIFTKTADTTLADITGLSVNVVAGVTYAFTAYLQVNPDAVGGSKYGIGGTATGTSSVEFVLIDNTTQAITAAGRGSGVNNAGTTNGCCLVQGTYTATASGTFTIQFAQKVASGASSVLVGSNFTVTPTN